MTQKSRARYVSLLVAVLALVAGAFVVIRGLQVYGGSPGGFPKFGTEGTAIPYDEHLGDVPLTPGPGHDGKFFFLQAHDPFLLDQQTTELLEYPLYRGQRLLYPLLASPAALLNDRALAWTMIGINLLALVIGTWATARLAVALGGSPWLGLTFGLNIGLIFELMIDGAGIVAWTFGVLGIWAAMSGRFGWAAAALTASILTREVMVLVAVGIFVGLWALHRRRVWSVLLVPAGVAGLWALWIRYRVGTAPLGTDLPAVGPPLQGLLDAIEGWMSGRGDALLGVTVIALFGVLVWQAVRRPGLVSWSVVGFALLAPFLVELVWLNGFDITRAAAPALTAVLVAAFTPRGAKLTEHTFEDAGAVH